VVSNAQRVAFANSQFFKRFYKSVMIIQGLHVIEHVI
jgi:hypothetical protein